MQQWQVSPVPEYIYSGSQTNQPPNEIHPHYAGDMSRRQDHFGYGAPQQHPPSHQQHPVGQHPPMSMPQPPQQQPQQQQGQRPVAPSHQQSQQHHPPLHHPPPQAHAQAHQQQQQQQPSQPQTQQAHQAPAPQQSTPQPAPRSRKRAAPTPTPAASAPAASAAATSAPPTSAAPTTAAAAASAPSAPAANAASSTTASKDDSVSAPPPTKKSRTNTPWTPAEEQRLKQMRDAGNSWAEIAKTFPTRTEGSVKKHWYKDMHYAEFAEDESQALMNAIKEYETNKWKVIGQKVGKPAKACEQYAKEHFPDLFGTPKARQ